MRPLVLIGYDSREDLAYRVCRASIENDILAGSIDILPLQKRVLEAAGLYRRGAFMDGHQQYDTLDGKPFSTEFSFSRFLSPVIASLLARETVLFVDSDFLFRSSLHNLFELADDRYAVQVVQHDYRPGDNTKMRGHVAQERYNRKLWSALMLMHVKRCHLTPFQVNTMPGAWLHGFQWLDDAQIGALPEEWHWVPGHSPPDKQALAVHFTTGTPDVLGREQDPYAGEWLHIAKEISRGDLG